VGPRAILNTVLKDEGTISLRLIKNVKTKKV